MFYFKNIFDTCDNAQLENITEIWIIIVFVINSFSETRV